MFFKDVFKIIYWIYDTEYNLSGRSNFSFYTGADILNALSLYDFFTFLHVKYMLRFEKAIFLSLLFKFILFGRLSSSLCGSDVLLL